MEDLILGSKSYYFVSMCIIIFAIVLFCFMFEKRKPKAREIVLIAVMVSLAVISRVMFFMTPQFKPMAAIIIMAGVAFGPQIGFLCGAISAFVSNMILGQGPWTPWQMVAFGVVGFFAGVFFYKIMNVRRLSRKAVIALCIYGLLAMIIIYGFIMDSATVIMYIDKPKVSAFLAAYATGFIYNVIHGVAVVVFLALLSEPILKKINRIKNKFGMFRDRIN